MKSGSMKRVIPTLFVVVCVALFFVDFERTNQARIAAQNAEYIDELTTQRAISIDSLIAENQTFIKSTAYLYGKSLTSSFADVGMIREFEDNSTFDFLRFIDASGDNYTSRGVMANLADREYFQAGMRGESGIAYVAQSRVTGQKQIGFYSPVYYDGQVIGVMVGFYGEDFITRMLEYELFGAKGEGWLCATDGTVLGSTRDDAPDNYLDFLAEDGRCTADELARVREAFANRTGTIFSCRVNGRQTTVNADALSSADWMLVRSFPPSATDQILANANKVGQTLLTRLVALFGLYVAYLVALNVAERRAMAEANRNANDISHGMTTLFNAFVRLDLDEYTYEYIGGAPTYPGMPTKGSYGFIAEGILKVIPEGEDEHRAEIAAYFDVDNMRANLIRADSISMRVHAPSTAGEWHTYNFVVLNRNADGTPHQLLVTLQDVTELHEREVREQLLLQDALDAAESASKAKTEFLFNMSHDLRTPMNAIIGYTELAQHEGVTADEMRGFIKKIDASSLHLLALINDILEMSRIESGKMTLAPEECDLAQVVNKARGLFSNQMREKGIDFLVDASSSVSDRWVLCDQNRLNRIILNLISNAYKFTDRGGSVKVMLVEESAHDGVGSYRLHVADTGIGMSPDFVDKLFTPFERERTSTVSRTQGTGLGLSITKKIVDLMGGTIEVKTEQGRGTEFIVHMSFPLVAHEAAPSHEEAVAVEAIDFTGTRVLLVEDQKINLEIATMLLSHYGFVLDTAENGQLAVDKVRAASPGDYDVILMDIQMPVMDGYTAAREIRALPNAWQAQIPIVAMTANAFQEDVQAALDAGMDGHIAKPIDVGKMLETLAMVLRR